VTRIGSFAGKFSVVLVGIWVFFSGYINAEGASWKYFFFSKDNKITYYYDEESISFPSPGNIRAWIKQVDEYDEYKKSHVELNCREKTYAFLAIISYTKENRVKYGSTYSPKWESFPAGSVLNFLNTILCPLIDRNNK
jgi:hypothetical protein